MVGSPHIKSFGEFLPWLRCISLSDLRYFRRHAYLLFTIFLFALFFPTTMQYYVYQMIRNTDPKFEKVEVISPIGPYRVAEFLLRDGISRTGR